MLEDVFIALKAHLGLFYAMQLLNIYPGKHTR